MRRFRLPPPLSRRPPRLTVWSAVNTSPEQVAASLAPLRRVPFELVLVVDSRVDGRFDAGYRRLADRVVRAEYPGLLARLYPWVLEHCSGEWILQVDADEVASEGLAEEVIRTIADRRVTHAFISRRWLCGGPDRFLAQWPWQPDDVLRLFRNDPALLRFPGVAHDPIAASGSRRYLRSPLYHADLLMNSYEQRVRKVARLDAESAELTLEGMPFNQAFYLPERRERLRTARVPAADFGAVQRFLRAGEGRVARVSDDEGGPDRPVPPPGDAVSKADIDRRWARRALAESAYRGRVRILDHDGSSVAGSWRAFDLEVENLGTETWPGGIDEHPQIRISYRWLAPGGQPVVPEGWRTELGAPLAPGESCRVPARVKAPDRPGVYRLQFDIVHEFARWFGCAVQTEVEVRAPPSLRAGPG